MPILRYLWPEIRKKIADAELHIRYGSELISDITRQELGPLLKQPGITEHGRSTYDEVLEERYRCLAQIYVTDTPMEIDCLSVREAAIAGCIPILSANGVFSERAGIHVNGDPKTKPVLQEAADTIVRLHGLPNEQLSMFRDALVSNALCQTWSETANKWFEKIA